jgi:hypothetical protein
MRCKDFSDLQVVTRSSRLCHHAKNHMKVLEVPELDGILNSHPATIRWRTGEVFATFQGAEKKAEPCGKAARAPSANPQKPPRRRTRRAREAGEVRRAQAGEKSAPPIGRVPEKRVIDTRGSARANLDKYDEKFENWRRAENRGAAGRNCHRLKPACRRRIWVRRRAGNAPPAGQLFELARGPV